MNHQNRSTASSLASYIYLLLVVLYWAVFITDPWPKCEQGIRRHDTDVDVSLVGNTNFTFLQCPDPSRYRRGRLDSTAQLARQVVLGGWPTAADLDFASGSGSHTRLKQRARVLKTKNNLTQNHLCRNTWQ